MIAALLTLGAALAIDVGQPLPSAPLVDSNGSVAILAPGEVRVVNLWAAWCGPCRAELPLFDGLATRLGEDAEVVLVSVDTSRPRAVALARHLHLGARVVFDGQPLADLIEPDTLPTTLVVGADGVVRHVHTGELKAEDFSSLEAEVRALLPLHDQ